MAGGEKARRIERSGTIDKRRLKMKRDMVDYSAVDITTLIITVRNKRVILDRDLAGLYGTTTKRLNEQVKRNRSRFPEDFMFQLTAGEWADLTSQTAMSNAQSNRSQIATGSQRHRDPRFAPYAFTEHGAPRGICLERWYNVWS